MSRQKETGRQEFAKMAAELAEPLAAFLDHPLMAESISDRMTPTRQYVEPKTASELGIVCLGISNAATCGKPVVWFDYEIGEKNHRKGFSILALTYRREAHCRLF